MFPLAVQTFPATAQELTSAIRDALADVLTLANPAGAVHAEGNAYPRIERLTVDLSGSIVDVTQPPPPKPEPVGDRQPGPAVERLDVRGQPLRVGSGSANLALTARGLGFDFAHDARGNALLMLREAREGSVDVSVSRADLQAILLAAASAAAKQQGVSIQDLQVNLTSRGPRSVAIDVRVEAKKSMFKGIVRLTGRADVDDDLNAAVSELACTGEGMVGSLAAGFLQNKLNEINGKRVSLMAFSLGDVKLRDLAIDTTDGLHVTARFGNA
jgi:hypothetical protein